MEHTPTANLYSIHVCINKFEFADFTDAHTGKNVNEESQTILRDDDDDDDDDDNCNRKCP